MPHVNSFRLNGKLIPSVNGITDSLSKDGLIRNFYRPLGFKEADKVGKAARDKGVHLATAFENYRKFAKLPRKTKRYEFEKCCIDNWQAWRDTTGLIVVPDFVEPHLINTKEGYHGSPDIVMVDMQGQAVLGDDKAKKRLSDYKILMNEAAYAHCDSFEAADGSIQPVPWDYPITGCWIWSYCPVCAQMTPEYKATDEQAWQDFLTCKRMRDVNKTSEKYFRDVVKKLGCGCEA